MEKESSVQIRSGWQNICEFAYNAGLGDGSCKIPGADKEFFERVCANHGNGCGHRNVIQGAQPIASQIMYDLAERN
jgi:hypothetical protein